MKNFSQAGTAMSRLVGLAKPKEEDNDLDKAGLLYQKRLARLRQMAGGQTLPIGRSSCRCASPDDGELVGQAKAKANLSIPAQVSTGFVPYITSVSKRCLMPIAYGLLLIAFTLFHRVALAQSVGERAATGVGEVTPLMVGQKVPDEFWTREHLFYINGDTVRRTLEEHKGKILVLDFWMSGCMPCLLHQREINYFKAEYPDDLAVVMVNSKKTREDFQKIDHFVQSDRFQKIGLGGLVSIIEDGYLQEMFPYRSYPSYFWINKLGILQTQTFRNLLDRQYQAPFKEKSA